MSPNFLITMFSLILVGMCFALASGWVYLGGILFIAAILIAMFGMHLLTNDDF